MSSKVFDIENFNILSDEENYYFFRALNSGDNKDIEEQIIIDENNEIHEIRTDRERYQGEAKYNETDNVSLDEVFEPKIAIKRAISYYKKRGYSDKWTLS